jgi:cysteine-rich repeat protein
MRTTLLALTLVFPLGVAVSHATTATDACTVNNVPSCGCVLTTCATTPGVCVLPVVKNGIAVAPSSTLDFGQCTLRVPPGAQLVVSGTGGSMTINAASVDIQATSQGAGALRALGGTIVITAATGDVNVRRMGNSIARIDASGDPAGGNGGEIDITAMLGNILIDGVLDAGANAADQDGGAVNLAAKGVTLGAASEVDVNAKGAGAGGTFAIDSDSNLTAGGKIDASGGDFDAGEIDLGAGGNVNVLATSNIDLQATQGGGSGGTLEIYGSSDQSKPVGGNVMLGGSVNMSGDSDGDFGGDGGELDIGDSSKLVGGSITITAPINASSGDGGGGGTVSLAAVQDIVQSAAIQVQGKGAAGGGGMAEFEAHRALTLGDIDASGDVGSIGEIDGTAWCSLVLPASGTLDATNGSGNFLAGGGNTMTIAGTMRALPAETGGTNELDYLTTAPTVTGSVVPAADVRQIDPLQDALLALEPCGTVPPPVCGDGVLQPGEQCDDGNKVNGDACDNNCTFPGCGNNIVDPGEQCDDGNMIAGDGCSPKCENEVCGNGELDPGEQCDDGPTGSSSCTPPCPGGGSSCTPAPCTLIPPPNCGNGTLDPGEQCDDGNKTDCDGCSKFCLIECGDGKISCNEQCDDGNTASNDGCSSTCQIEFCGDHITQTSEECDDGANNGVLGDPCSATCTLHWCGDGKVDPGEQCDDGNANNCDTCKTDCTPVVNTCPTCTSESPDRNECLACTTNAECDPLQACGTSACIGGACTPVAPPNCDDGNPCTADGCSPASGCTHTPKSCDDGNACNGTESCDPGSGQCVHSPAPNCDDGDPCTDDDRCESNGAGHTCVTTPRVGQAGVSCRLSGIQQVLNGASDLKKGTKKKIGKLLRQVQAKLPATSGTSKKATKARKVVNARLQTLSKLIGKTKASPGTISELRDAVAKAITALGGL